MIDFLNTLDTNIFLFLNGINSAFFDQFMYIYTGKWIWIPFYAAIVYVFIRNWKKESIWIILAVALCITIADQLAANVIRSWIERPRPSHEPELEGLVHIVNNLRGGRLGFVSAHAANSIGLALFCSMLFRYKLYTWVLFAWAIVNAYSRIYLGVHYPGDLIGGAIVGIFAALVCIFLLKKLRPKIFLIKPETNFSQETSFCRKQENFLPIWVVAFTVLGIAVYGLFVM